MAGDVFANNREIASKAGGGVVICAFPDVCFTPPQTPATPPGAPIPYPNTGKDDDTAKGSKKTKIKKKDILLKNQSYFKTSYGDEAGCAPKKGIITSKNTGKVYFQMWSMDVKVEGKNVARHLDITTNNHASQVGDTPPWPFAKSMADAKIDPCKEEKEREQGACEGCEDPCKEAGLDLPTGKTKKYDATFQSSTGSFRDRQEWMDAWERSEANECLRARRCKLERYNGGACCCPGQTGHHLIEASSFFETGRGDTGTAKAVEGINWTGKPSDSRPSNEYHPDRAPCMCAEGTTSTQGSHGALHTEMKAINSEMPTKELNLSDGSKTSVKSVKYKDAKANASAAAAKVFPLSKCSKSCIEAQLDNYHNDKGINNDTDLVAVEAGKAKKQLPHAQAYTEERRQRKLREYAENLNSGEASGARYLTGASAIGSMGGFRRR